MKCLKIGEPTLQGYLPKSEGKNQSTKSNNNYNPQNEMFQVYKTKRIIL